MTRSAYVLLAGLWGLFPMSSPVPAAGDDVVFRSDVSLVRVDAQVVDRDNRAVAGLQREDFILLEQGQKRDITTFETEDLPVDVLLLLDVSASMRPHLERIAAASHQALSVLGEADRVGIMVFDRSTRVRLTFRANRAEIEHGLEAVLNDESFNGGTDITRGLLDAAKYIGREGRKEARRAIVIVTDDQTERNRDEDGVSRALVRADAVLCLLLAPDAMRYGQQIPGGRGGGSRRRGTWGSGGGGWPGSGPTMGGPLGGIILGRRGGPYGGPGSGPGSGPVIIGPHTHSAGTAEIATRSGGDHMGLEDASAFETTLERIRKRYALYFHLPDGVQPGQERGIEVELADAARRRYAGAELRYRRVYLTPGGPANATQAGPVEISKVPVTAGAGSSDTRTATNSSSANGTEGESRDSGLRRRPGVDPGSGPRGPMIGAGNDSDTQRATAQPAASPAPKGGWRKADDPAPVADPKAADTKTTGTKAADAKTTDKASDSNSGGWRKLKPGEKP